MGKDNSVTKTSFEIQKEKMSEELKKIHHTIANGVYTVERDINIHSLALDVLRKFNENLITLKYKTEICTEKKIQTYSEPYINISNYFVEYEKKKKTIPFKQWEQFKGTYLNEIEPEIIKLLNKFLDKLIDYLNKSVPGYTFFLTSIEIKDWTVYIDKFYCRFEFGIDFK